MSNTADTAPGSDASNVDIRVDRARLNYVKERLKDLREERERLMAERELLRGRLEAVGNFSPRRDGD